MDGNNIPHMTLFHYLKQKFPDLKDNDVNESIQKFGLNREKCELELEQKTLVHYRGYYGPWGRNRSSPSSSTSSTVTSPQRDLDMMTPSPVITDNPPNITHHNTTAFHYVDYPVLRRKGTETPSTAHSTTDGWLDSITNDIKINPHYNVANRPASQMNQFINQTTYIPVPSPNSAPVVSPSKEPFAQFPNEVEQQPYRRWSEQNDVHIPNLFLLEEKFDKKLTLQHSINEPDNKRGSTPCSPAANQSTKDLPVVVQEQLQHKSKLEEEISQRLNEKMKLTTELSSIEQNIKMLRQKTTETSVMNVKKIGEIQENNQRLQQACDQMEAEILQSGETPDTEQESYTTVSQMTNMRPTRQRTSTPTSESHPRESPVSTVSSGNNTPVNTQTPTFIPSRPTHPSTSNAQGRPRNSSEAEPPSPESEGWNCSKCTYLNADPLQMCEVCGFPRYNIGMQHSSGAPQPPCYCRRHQHYCHESPGELQDIHIQVRRQNLGSPR